MNLNGEKILEFIPESALVISTEGKVISANELFLSQYGVKRRFITAQLPINELIQFERQDYLKDSVDTFLETDFKIIPSAISGTCLLGTRKIDDQYLLVIKDNSVEVQLHTKYQKQLDELAEYSRGLEEKVKIRTKELSDANQFISGMLDSLNQAILVLDAEGKCQPYYTSNCSSMFHMSPEGKFFWDILECSKEEVPFLKRWISHLIKEKINFEDIAELGPQKISKNNSHLELKYFPLRSEKFTAEGIVVVGRDITRMVELETDLHTTEEFEKILTRVATNLFIYRSAVEEQDMGLKELMQLKETDEVRIKKVLHRLKGSFSLFSMQALEKMTHEMEEMSGLNLPDWKKSFTELEKAVHLLHAKIASSLSIPAAGSQIWVNRDKIVELASKIQHPYKEELLAMATMRLHDYLKSFTAYADELCHIHGKKIHDFIVKGPELPVFNHLIMSLQPIMTHYLRNVVDHGFWDDDEKENDITVEYELKKDRLFLSIADTGKGNAPKTPKAPTLTSGRGLGMQIIQELLNELNGSLQHTFLENGCVLKMEMEWPAQEASRG